MSKIKVNLEGQMLTIVQERTRMTPFDTFHVDAGRLMYGVRYRSDMLVHSKKMQNKILFLMPYDEFQKNLEHPDSGRGEAAQEEDESQEQDSQDVLAVWTDDVRVSYGYMPEGKVYEYFFKFIYKTLHVGLNKRYLSLWLIGYFWQLNPRLTVDRIRFYIDEWNRQEANIQVSGKHLSYGKVLSLKNIHHFKIPVAGLLNERTQINNMLNMVVTADGHDIEYRIGRKKPMASSPRVYYAPYKSCYVGDFALHLRRTERGNFAIVKREKEEEEKKAGFRFMESRFVSGLLYHLGKFISQRSKKKVNLFYEKFSGKAEEGTFELFLMSRDQGNSDCYYIIDENSEDYKRIGGEKNVVRKYSLKYYWLLYRVNHYISTEAPAHLNILRSNNHYFRLSTSEHPFIFLQHGVTYLKCQGPSSTFVAGKEGEPSYMVVGSEKERDVCADMLSIPEERFLNTGLPIFSKIDYKQMDPASPDKAVIMLTWKTYEEHLKNFETSDYYKNVIAIYEILRRHMDKEDIIIVPHPKVLDLLESTSLKDSIWKEPISKVLKVAKLLVTDYSSACYNSFYQGGAVVFYQPDLELYEREAGKLIPSDEEYIGKRVYDLEALEQVISEIVQDGRILLEKGRTKEYEQRYQTINEYNDGENITRIFRKLQDLGMV